MPQFCSRTEQSLSLMAGRRVLLRDCVRGKQCFYFVAEGVIRPAGSVEEGRALLWSESQRLIQYVSDVPAFRIGLRTDILPRRRQDEPPGDLLPTSATLYLTVLRQFRSRVSLADSKSSNERFFERRPNTVGRVPISCNRLTMLTRAPLWPQLTVVAIAFIEGF